MIARQTILKSKTGTYGILSLVVLTAIATDAAGLEDHPKHVLQEIELMGCHIIEITTSSHLRMQSPRQVATRADSLSISGTKRFCITYLDIDNPTYSTTFNDIENFLKIRKIPTIVSYKTRHARLL